MKKIILSLAVIAIAGVIGVGATRAYFSSTATVTGNTFSSGTLGLNIGDATHSWTSTGWDATSNPFANLAPGQSGDIYLEMQQTGTVPSTGTISLAAISGIPSDLANNLTFTVSYDGTDHYDATRATYTNWTTTSLNSYSLAQLFAAGSPTYPLGPITSSDKTAHVKIHWTVNTALTTQGQSVTFNTILGLTQNIPVVVSPSNLNGWQMYADTYATANGSNTSFTADGLRLQTFGNDSRVGLYNLGLNSNLNGLQISYETNQVSATNPVGNATIRLSINLTGGNTVDDQLMYEPYYNLQADNALNQASITPNTWQTWSLNNANGKFWSNNAATYNGKGGVGAGSYASNFTIADVLAQHPNAKIVGISFSMGTYNPDQVVLIDNFVMNGTTYNFEN